MKTAALMHAMKAEGGAFDQILVHTGQHYDRAMSDVFFEELGLPEPNAYLSVGSGTHAEQTSKAMATFEPVLLKFAPDVVVVVGDVNSTLGREGVDPKRVFFVGNVMIDTLIRLLPKTNPERACAAVSALAEKGKAKHTIPELWDGHASERIARILLEQ